MKLQESPRHLGIFNETSKEMMQLLSLMLKKPWDGSHTCSEEEETVNCTFCQNIALWHQLASKIMQHFCPRDPTKIPTKEIPKVDEVKHISKPSKEEAKNGK